MPNTYIADTVLMVKPINFGFNEEAAETNAFQNKIKLFDATQIQQIAKLEFEAFVDKLRSNGINVLVFEDNDTFHTPDSIFPNNWFNTCPHNKKVFTYPMKNANRSAERREDILARLIQDTGYERSDDFLLWEQKNKALEGTGSLVLDHQNKLAFAALSPRTEMEVLTEWAKETNFKLCTFYAYGPKDEHIYHTNVVMTMADEYAIIALDTIKEATEKNKVRAQIEDLAKKELIEISIEQMNKFAGNMLQLQNDRGQKFLVMSSTAHRSLNEQQISTIESFNNTILSVPINMIELIGGGSARCMMAEVFKK